MPGKVNVPGTGMGTFGFGPTSGQYEDDIFDDAALFSMGGLSIQLTCRVPLGTTTPNAPWAGVAETPNFAQVIIPAYLFTITPRDVFESGGYFQMGDVKIGLEELALESIQNVLKSSQSESGFEGMRFLFPATNPLEYRIIGQIDFEPIGKTKIVFKAHLRKVGLGINTGGS